METRYEFLENEKKELGELDFINLFSSLENEYYEMVQKEVKGGKTISEEVYNSLTEGQKFHFNKHYNHRKDKVIYK